MKSIENKIGSGIKKSYRITIDTFTDQPVEVSLRATWLLESILFLLHVVADIKIVARSSGLSLVMHNNKRDDHRSRAENDSAIFCEFYRAVWQV